jgi:ribosome-binding protein aMBF1 (putative translation factor)
MATIPEGSVDALEYVTASIATSLREAREVANLSQPELAKKMKKSQSMVAGAEAGRIRVSERYVQAVLKACKLPKDWQGSGGG